MSQWKIQKKENLHLQFSDDIPFPSTHRKENQRPKLWWVSNLKIFHTIDINEMAAFFQFFHNGQHWYFISISTRKTGDPNFGGSVIWNFSAWSILTKWQPFFNFFIMAQVDIPFPSTLGKLETQILERSVIWNFSVRLILMKWQPFLNFFIMANVDIPFPLTLGKPKTQTLGGLVIWNFSMQSILTKWQPFFNFFIMANADILFPSTLGKLETQTLGGW